MRQSEQHRQRGGSLDCLPDDRDDPIDVTEVTCSRGFRWYSGAAQRGSRDGAAENRSMADDGARIAQLDAELRRVRAENAALREHDACRERALTEALQDGAATREILRVIAASPTDLQRVLEALAQSVSQLCQISNVIIWVAEQSVMRVLCHLGPGAGRLANTIPSIPLTRSTIVGRSIIDRVSIHAPDYLAAVEGEYPDSRAGVESGLYAALSVPLIREGVAIGAIGIGREEIGPFSPRQIALVETFADQAVIAIENARLFEELRYRVDELQALGEVGQALSSSLDLPTVLTAIVSNAARLSGSDGGVLYEYDDDEGVFVLQAGHPMSEPFESTLRAARFRLGEGAVGQAGISRAPFTVEDIAASDALTPAIRDELLLRGQQSILAVPLLREDRVLGGLVMARRTPGPFPPETVELLQTFATQSALAIHNARLYQALEEASRHKSQFLANMSHELRTPLNSIIGFSVVLSERMFGDLNDRQAEYVRDIHTSGQYLLSLINDILDLSKVEAGRMDVDVRAISLRETLEHGLMMFEERAMRHGISFGLELDDGLDEIEADERKLKQVMFNLISNAVKFTPDGGHVDLRIWQIDDAVYINVIDTGVGIAPGDLEHLFDDFRQVGRGGSNEEGTGLGLAISRRFCRLMGGDLSVSSVYGQGSTFTVRLPASMRDALARA